jgi:uncharacterized membrane protein YfcA
VLTATALVVVGGAFAGGFVSGLAGFGTGLMALGIWLHVLDPVSAAVLVVVCSVVAQVQTIPAIWHAIDRARVGPMIVAGLFGVPLGGWLVHKIDPNAFRLGMGLLLVAFSGFMLFGRPAARVTGGSRIADAAVGFGGGVLGGLSGLSAPLPIMWATLCGWGKDERRGVFQAFSLSILLAAALLYAVSGRLTAQVGWLVLEALPGTLCGAWLGAHTYRRLSDRRFHEVVLGLLGLSGLALVWTSLGW